MVELSNERIGQILNEETPKNEELTTILRAVYNRYMCLYEKYFADIDALNDDVIAELRTDHEETRSLMKHYYMDVPLDVTMELLSFDEDHTDKLLGTDWQEHLLGRYEEFRSKSSNEGKSEDRLKTEFREENLDLFYSSMDSAFRDDFGTGSRTAEEVVGGLKGLLFGK